MAVAIKVENLSKAYQIGQIGTGTVSRDLERWWITKIRGKEDPFLKIGETNDRSKKGESDIVWSLKNINFEIEQGEAVGIIGRNGAGKSTLLKLLSEVTSPTSGKINIKGRTASLLEVGTGFHPELSGRENIFLNGAILGMRKWEIKKKFDEIVDFSGVERYIDTPVKRYSSGMYVRLAFAVAAHLEPEILIVDEVLAVGDAEFQKKCLGKMKDVSVNGGRTVLFVSHNMSAIKSLCTKGLLLDKGKSNYYGNIGDVITSYQNLNEKSFENILIDSTRQGTGECRLNFIRVLGSLDKEKNTFSLGERIKVELTIEKKVEFDLKNIRIIIGVYNSSNEGFLRFDTLSTNTNFCFNQDNNVIYCELLEHLNIKADIYTLNVAIFQNEILLDYVPMVIKMNIESFDYFGTGRDIDNSELSKVYYKHIWKDKI